MKLQEYNPIPRHSAAIKLYPSTGVFALNVAAKKLLKAEAFSVIKFFQDEKNPKNWYIRVFSKDQKEKGGISIRENERNGDLLFSKATLMRDLVKILNFPEGVSHLSIEEPEIIDGHEYFKITVKK